MCKTKIKSQLYCPKWARHVLKQADQLELLAHIKFCFHVLTERLP